ncbi:MAG: hypothetical protein AB1648_04275 [Pseudomonadota bacterium]|jgi:hypothetical protein
MTFPVPQTYSAWRHCIEVECGIPLTAAFLQARLAALRDEEAGEARRFRRLYGDAHWLRVLGWFEHAAQETLP